MSRFRPAGFRNGRPASRPEYRAACTAAEHRISRWVDRMAAAGLTEPLRLGMEGAFEAMGSGTVDLNWAKEHHSLWREEEGARDRTGASQPQPTIVAGQER